MAADMMTLQSFASMVSTVLLVSRPVSPSYVSGLNGADCSVLTAGGWSEPMSRPVCQVTPPAISPVIRVMSGVEHPPIARLILVGSPSLRQMMFLSVAHSTVWVTRVVPYWACVGCFAVRSPASGLVVYFHGSEGRRRVAAMLRAGGLTRRPVSHPGHTQPPLPQASPPISARLGRSTFRGTSRRKLDSRPSHCLHFFRTCRRGMCEVLDYVRPPQLSAGWRRGEPDYPLPPPRLKPGGVWSSLVWWGACGLGHFAPPVGRDAVPA